MNYNLSMIRIMGILQRVAVCYYAVALMEIFLPRSKIRVLPAHRGPLGILSIFQLFWRYVLPTLPRDPSASQHTRPALSPGE